MLKFDEEKLTVGANRTRFGLWHASNLLQRLAEVYRKRGLRHRRGRIPNPDDGLRGIERQEIERGSVDAGLAHVI